MKDRTVSVTEFKAKCLALLDDISRHGGTITIVKRGRPLATVTRAEEKPWPTLEGKWAGKIELPDDDVFFRDTSDMWDCVHGRWEPNDK
jgi:prevent-host-death family protein